jgi:cytochrome P450
MTAVSAFSVNELLHADILPDPYPAYRRLRMLAPVYWDADINAWIITGYPESVAVLKDTESFCSDWRRIGESVPAPLLSIQSLDPPEHTEIRRLMLAAFRYSEISGIDQVISAGVEDLCRGLRGRDTFDFVTGFAEPLALRAVSHLLGVPEPETSWFIPVSHAIVDSMDAGLRPQTHAPGVQARAELAELTGTWLATRPSHGLLGWIASNAGDADVDGDLLRNTLRTVLHAGFESASRFLSAGLLALLRSPDGLRQPVSTVTAASELARFVGPVQADSRGCVRPSLVGGQAISPGEEVTLLIGAANRDPRAFDQPESLCLDRDPNHHLGFGRGAHSCLGSAIAQKLARIAFGVLSSIHPDIRLAGEPVWRANATLRGLERLEVSWPR